jgi:hypothetical protein
MKMVILVDLITEGPDPDPDEVMMKFGCHTWLIAVLRIRDVYPGSRFRIQPFLVSRIPDPDPTVFYPGSRIRILQIREGCKLN